MTRVKVCGLTDAADLSAAVAAGADAVGVVADVPVDTPRAVGPDRAADLVAAAPPFATTVLVTMPDDPDRAAALVREVGADALQVHGDLSPDDGADVAARTDTSLLRAVPADDPAAARRHDDAADALVLDTPAADGAGGTGRTHDWARAAELAGDLDSPVVLAGGLTPDNVAAAVEAVDPYAVDVASGVERRGGEKDHAALAAFVESAKRPTPTP